MTGNILCAAALAYASLRFYLIPLHWVVEGECSCRRKYCSTPGKHPMTQHGLKDASCDLRQIEQWWGKWPNANIGIATGNISGIVVLDVDERSGGQETLDELISRFGPLPPSWVARTGGGRHFYWKHPESPMKSRSGIAKGLDVKADGGYVVAPPSRHWTGKLYEWEVGVGTLLGTPLPIY
jgi:putative DNA primase/helicase